MTYNPSNKTSGITKKQLNLIINDFIVIKIESK